MKISINRIFLLVFTVFLGPVAANAVPTLDPATGHNYEVVVAPKITWQAASDAIALLPPFAGVNGHLATITSAGEDLFIHNLRIAAGLSNEAWVGGFQAVGSTEPVPGTNMPYDGWTWVNSEGLIPAPGAAIPPAYENWNTPEPNNVIRTATATTFASEDFLAVGLGNGQGWNDEGALNNIGGYVVEYDTLVVVDAGDCADPDGCELPGTTLVFPPSTIIDPGDVITVESFEFDDPPGRCGTASRVLFGAPDPRPDVNIPAWLCGSPKFLILALDTSQVEFPDGVILVTNDPASALPGNLYTCDSPNIPVGSDLRQQDVVGWQTTAFGDMVEARFHVANPESEFANLAVPFSGVPKLGHMGEYTDGCSSTRGRVRGGSYIGIGLHIHPTGTAAEGLVDNAPDFTLDQINRITRYKLALLQFSIIESKPVLSRNDFRYMKKQVGQAIKQMNKGNFNAARAHVQNVEGRAETAVYGTSVLGNENGEHLSRSANIIFMLDQKSSLP